MATINRKLEILQLEVELEGVSFNLDAAIAALLLEKLQQRKRRQRRRWSRPWLLRRPQFGHFEQLLQELQVEDASSFKNFIRMEPNMFKELLDRVGPHIEKQDTFWRKSLSPGLRLAITLRYLATGESYKSLQYGFRVAHNTISLIIPETCEAIFQEYKHEVLSCPKTPDEWKKVASLFSKRWHFHHTVGALDGKHIAIRCPPNGGSRYYNYKGFHSIVLMAVADADYKFLFCDVGATGCSSDGGIFSATTLREALEKNTIGLPAPEPLPGDDKPIPFFLVGDDAFPLREWMMKPFPSRNLGRPERIFNYRLSRARRIIENAFGIMASR